MEFDDRQKQAVRRKVYKAIRNGILLKPKQCSNCPSNINIQGHHDDYNNPLQVKWLCWNCHKAIHVANGTWKKKHNMFTLKSIYRKAVTISKNNLLSTPLPKKA